MSNGIEVTLYSFGTALCGFETNEELKEILRVDPRAMIEDIRAEDFSIYVKDLGD